MKTLFPVIAALLFFRHEAHSQLLTKDSNNPAVKALIAGKTYAVLTGDDTFNEWFRGVVEKHWTVTTIEIINEQDLDTLVKSDKNIFLFTQSRDNRGGMHLLTTEDIAEKKEYMFMLSQGGHKQTKTLFTSAISGPKIIAGFRYSPERAEATAGLLEAELLLALLNQSLQIVIENNIKGNVRDSVKERISREAPAMAEKTLLVNQAYEDGTIELDKKVLVSDKTIESYSYNYQFVSKFDLESKLSDSSINPCYLFLYYPSNYVNQADDSGDILVYDPEQKKFLFMDDNYEGPWVEKWEIKDMSYYIKD